MPQPIHTIVIFPRPHPDNIVAILLLWLFGEKEFPGIRKAKIDFWNKVPEGKTADQLEKEGVLLIDLGGGKFDHHSEEKNKTKGEECATTLVAKYLRIQDDPALEKLIAYVKRDDLEGRGIISKDPLDRAFGLSGIIMNLNREYPQNPKKVLELVIPIFLAHYHEERKRMTVLPEVWEKIQKEGKADIFEVFQGKKLIKVIMVENDDPSLIGFLRASPKTKADVVAQKLSSGHINIITRQWRKVNLDDVAVMIRVAEARKKQTILEIKRPEDLAKPNRLNGVEEWYYDTVANSIQNGGIQPEGILPTKFEFSQIKEILKASLNPNTLSESCPKNKCLKEECDFYDYHLKRCFPIQQKSLDA